MLQLLNGKLHPEKPVDARHDTFDELVASERGSKSSRGGNRRRGCSNMPGEFGGMLMHLDLDSVLAEFPRAEISFQDPNADNNRPLSTIRKFVRNVHLTSGESTISR